MEAAEKSSWDMATKGRYLVWKSEEKQETYQSNISLPFYFLFAL
jgi:hypothetical protein